MTMQEKTYLINAQDELTVAVRTTAHGCTVFLMVGDEEVELEFLQQSIDVYNDAMRQRLALTKAAQLFRQVADQLGKMENQIRYTGFLELMKAENE